MVILLKSWKGNIVVKLFTTFVSEYLKIFLRNSLEKLGNSSREIPRNWFWRPFCYKFSLVFLTRNSSELVNSWEKLSTFSPDFPVKDSWEFPRIFYKIVTWVSYLIMYHHSIYSRYTGYTGCPTIVYIYSTYRISCIYKKFLWRFVHNFWKNFKYFLVFDFMRKVKSSSLKKLEHMLQ